MILRIACRTLGIIAVALILGPPARAAAPSAQAVLSHYADLAEIIYGDSLKGAEALDKAVGALIAAPSPATLAAARSAWKAARVPYVQSEGFRFGNEIVDDWEGRVNAWPVDEGLIDYVAPFYAKTVSGNPLAYANVIANTKIRIGPETVDATVIDKTVLRKLHAAADTEANVATGFHAIEFLLWGEDLHGTGPGAGERPATDFDPKACTGGHCDRRAAYLKAAAGLLVEDLREMHADWGKAGAARIALANKGPDGGLAAILTGIAMLSYDEMAGDRMKVGLILHDPEHEQDCFSDNSQNSLYYDEAGLIGLWRGHYTDSAGKTHGGPSLRDYASVRDNMAARKLDTAMEAAQAKLAIIKDKADKGVMAYDQMIGPNNPAGNKLVQDAVDALVAQTHAAQAVSIALKLTIKFPHSDDLEPEAAPN